MRKIYSLPYEDALLNKQNALSKADEIIDKGLISGMSRQQIADEIFAHCCAVRFLRKPAINKLPLAEFLLNRADPIDMADGGDYPGRKLVYRICWLLHR